MSELTHDLLRRVLVVTQFEYTDSLFWSVRDGVLGMSAHCSDFFEWGCADCEEIETEEDVALLEQCLVDLQQAATEQYPMWLTELYAARKRRRLPAEFMFHGKYAMEPKYHALFRHLDNRSES